VKDEIGCFFLRSDTIFIGKCKNQLHAFLADFLHPKVAIRQQAPRITLLFERVGPSRTKRNDMIELGDNIGGIASEAGWLPGMTRRARWYHARQD
jgi:hypothetical protein